MDKEPLKIVLAIIHKKGEVLLIKRRQKDILVPELSWAFPGGKARENETMQESLTREINEETGLNVEVNGEIFVRKYPGANILQIFYDCEPKDSEPLVTAEPEEVEEIRWVKAPEALSYFTSDVDNVIKDFLLEIESKERQRAGKELKN